MFGSWVKALSAVVFASSVYAQQQQQQRNTSASTFYLDETETQFSVSLADNSSDVYIYFTSPAYSWVGVGFGESMKNSLMLIMYPNAAGDDVTVSPRISSSNSEPSFAPDVKLDILNGTGIDVDMFVLKAVCRTCRVWPGGSIDASSTLHPMIFAFGPGNRLQSDDPNAPLKRHVRYGKFTMDMRLATSSDAGVPQAETRMNGVTMESLKKDSDRKNLAHALMGCIALFVLWPINVLLAGFLRNIKIHVGFSVAILGFLVASYGLGISTSTQYNRSKTFTSPHQVIAFLALLPTLLMALLPLKPLAALRKWIPRLHTPLTNLTFTLLVLTGGLGLHLSSATNAIILAYVAITLIIFVFIFSIVLCVRRRGSAYARASMRRRLGEEDEADLGAARWGVRTKMGGGNTVDGREESWQQGQSQQGQQGQGHARSGSAGSGKMFGGGTMPGPQYMMNMHPGVPVYVK